MSNEEKEPIPEFTDAQLDPALTVYFAELTPEEQQELSEGEDNVDPHEAPTTPAE